MTKTHRYAVIVKWTGSVGTGTSGYRSYERRREILSEREKPPIPGSSDPAFRGNPTRWNPEELLVAASSACHQLAYLHLFASAGIDVVSYADRAEGVMDENLDGSASFRDVILRPGIALAPGSDIVTARELHDAAHTKCFIAKSVNFPVHHEPDIHAA